VGAAHAFFQAMTSLAQEACLMSDPNGGSKVLTPSGHLGNVPAHHGGAARGHLLLGHREIVPMWRHSKASA
jgi:hypothetical protein